MQRPVVASLACAHRLQRGDSPLLQSSRVLQLFSPRQRNDASPFNADSMHPTFARKCTTIALSILLRYSTRCAVFLHRAWCSKRVVSLHPCRTSPRLGPSAKTVREAAPASAREQMSCPLRLRPSFGPATASPCARGRECAHKPPKPRRNHTGSTSFTARDRMPRSRAPSRTSLFDLSQAHSRPHSP